MITENMRREARVDARVAVLVHRGKHTVELITSDVSFKGLFVCTEDPPELRSLVRLTVSIGHHEFETHAMAVHVVGPGDIEGRPAGVGLQFWGLSGRDRGVWDDFVQALVHARRAPARAAAKAAQTTLHIQTPQSVPLHPALSEPMTPSGVRIVVGAAKPRVSSDE